MLFAATLAEFWCLLPLIVTVSLVYGATRDERMGAILHHALRFGLWVAGFLLVIFVILLAISWAV